MCRVEEKISPNDRQLFRITIDPTITHGKKLVTVIICLQLVNLLVTYWYSYYRSNYYTHGFLLPQKLFSFFFRWIWFLRSGYVFFLYFNSLIGSKKIEYYTYIEKRRDTVVNIPAVYFHRLSFALSSRPFRAACLILFSLSLAAQIYSLSTRFDPIIHPSTSFSLSHRDSPWDP